MVSPHLAASSRHFLSLQCSSLAPFSLGQERLVAVGAFEQDAEVSVGRGGVGNKRRDWMIFDVSELFFSTSTSTKKQNEKPKKQQHRLAIIHLRAEGGNNSNAVKAVELAAWVPPAAVTCSAAAQIPSTSSNSSTTTLLAAGCADGSLCRLRVSFPRSSPGATIAETKLNEDDFEAADLLPWRKRLHAGAVTSVAVSSSSDSSSSAVVASSGSDGSIVLTPVDSSSSDSSRVVVPARPAASVSALAWAGPETLAACGTASPVELFDARSRSQSPSGRPVARAVASSSSASSDASLLCVHPTRPNLAATGGRRGIALWDLRFLSKGAVASLSNETSSSSSSTSLSFSFSFSPLLKGGVTGLAFDPLPSAGLSDNQTPRLLFSTGDGAVGSARMGSSGGGVGGSDATFSTSSDASLLFREAGASALALAVEQPSSLSDSSRDIFVSTDQECLVYLQRPLI